MCSFGHPNYRKDINKTERFAEKVYKDVAGTGETELQRKVE